MHRTLAERMAAARRRCTARTSALSMLLLAAFAVQAVAVQSHVHLQRSAAVESFSAVALDTADGTPVGDYPANCPICHEFLNAGTYVAPEAAAAPREPAAYVIDLARNLPSETGAIHHGWQGRAPPIA